jgi:hypothetical protein
MAINRSGCKVDRNPMFFIATSRRCYKVERNPMEEGEIGRKEGGEVGKGER